MDTIARALLVSSTWHQPWPSASIHTDFQWNLLFILGTYHYGVCGQNTGILLCSQVDVSSKVMKMTPETVESFDICFFYYSFSKEETHSKLLSLFGWSKWSRNRWTGGKFEAYHFQTSSLWSLSQSIHRVLFLNPLAVWMKRNRWRRLDEGVRVPEWIHGAAMACDPKSHGRLCRAKMRIASIQVHCSFFLHSCYPTFKLHHLSHFL